MDRIVIGNKIRQIRKDNRLSQEEFAYRIGVSRQTVSSWELGVMKPEISKIKAICKMFDIKADDILFDSAADLKSEIEEKDDEVAACPVADVVTEDYVEENAEPDIRGKAEFAYRIITGIIKGAIALTVIAFLVFCMVVVSRIIDSPNTIGESTRIYGFNFGGNDALKLYISIGAVMIAAIAIKVFVLNVIKYKISRR